MITDLGTEQGWGKGEISGMMNNFKSVSAIIAPALLAQAYAHTTTPPRSFPGSPMLVCAVVTLLSELLYKSI